MAPTKNAPIKTTPTRNKGLSYPVIWKILGLFSSPISREIDHTQLQIAPPISQPSY